MERRRQTGKGSQAPRNTTMVSSLDFMLASYIPDLQLKKMATLKCQQVQTRLPPPQKKASKSAFQPKDQKRGKTNSQGKKKSTLLQINTTEKTVAPPMPAKVRWVTQTSIYLQGSNKAPRHTSDAEETMQGAQHSSKARFHTISPGDPEPLPLTWP